MNTNLYDGIPDVPRVDPMAELLLGIESNHSGPTQTANQQESLN